MFYTTLHDNDHITYIIIRGKFTKNSPFGNYNFKMTVLVRNVYKFDDTVQDELLI